MTQAVLASAIVSFIFAYLAMNMEAAGGRDLNIRAAILSYVNLFLCYGSILTTLYLALQDFQLAQLPGLPGGGSLLSGFINIYALLILGVFFFVTWDLYLSIFKEEQDAGGPGGG